MRPVMSVSLLTALATGSCGPAAVDVDCLDVPLEACDVTPGCRLVQAHRVRADAESGYACWQNGVVPVACQVAFDADRCPAERTPASGAADGPCLLFDDVCTPEGWAACDPPAPAFCPSCETLDVGPFLAPSRQIEGPDGLGRHLAGGDLSGDGVPDLAVNAIDGVRVYFGPVGPDSAVLTLRSGDRPTDEEVFLAIGDLDGDGVGDLVVGAPSAQRVDSTGRHGQIAWHPGPLSPGEGALLADAARRIEGSVVGDELGAGLAIADLHGDGVPDLLAVVRSSDVFERDGGALLRMPGPFAAGSVELAQQASDARIAGPATFGAAFAIEAAGPGEAPTLLVERPGGIVVRVAFDEDDREATIDDGEVVARAGALDGDGIITGLAVGDVDGDDAPEFVVALPAEPGAWDDVGRVQVMSELSGEVAGPDADGRGRCDSDRLGSALVVVDLDGDGVDDVIVGGTGGANFGGLVVRGPVPAGEARWTDTGLRLGITPWGPDVAVVDLDGDGAPEIVAGTPSTGRVEIYDGAAVRAALGGS